MPQIDRRRFLTLAGGAAALTALPQSIARAASLPANREHGDIRDVEHIVVLMQENRSFDHMFGTMRGVRGFGDPHPAVLPSGKPVWNQSDGTKDVLPFRPDKNDLGLAFIQDLDHSWDGTHAAAAAGQWDGWIPAKGTTTMAHLERHDMPFHFALADAFTVCDAYHCSLLGPTDPNRYYMWTGWVGNDGKGTDGKGPVIGNDELGYSWTTYPERLQRAGVSWKIYQDSGIGLDKAGVWGYTDDAYIGNYGDNSLLYFDQYRNADPSSPLYQRARTGTEVTKGGTFFDVLRADVRHNRLPQISYVVAPEAFTEHPNWPVNYGAWYTAKVLDALTSNPDVWSKTAVLITYDENDGFFDHVVSPAAASSAVPGASTVSTENELYTGPEGVPGNYGLGVRVPMIVVSPWSTGGWVCSETFDHTSIIRFMERRFGVHEPQVTPWRRTVAGDLTAAFDFGRTRTHVPSLPNTAAYKPKDDQRHPDYVPTPPADPRLPRQEKGVRPSRALGYDLRVSATPGTGRVDLRLRNSGRLGAAFQLRQNGTQTPPQAYTVGAGDSLTASVPVTGGYDLALHGPNGFYRRWAAGATSGLTAETEYRGSTLLLHLTNKGKKAASARIADAYSGRSRTVTVPAGHSVTERVGTDHTGGWYDVTVTSSADAAFAHTSAGRIETGHPSISDPQLGAR